jgi:hypothetical protein
MVQLIFHHFLFCQDICLKIPKGIIRSSKSKDRHYIGQKKEEKGTYNDLPNITQKTKDKFGKYSPF